MWGSTFVEITLSSRRPHVEPCSTWISRSRMALASESASGCSRKSIPVLLMISVRRSSRGHGGVRSISGLSPLLDVMTADPVTSIAMVDTICSTISITSP